MWSHIAEKRERHRFEAVSRRSDWLVVVPPATLLEAGLTKKAALRRELLRTIVGGRREHLATEVASEAAEFVGVVKQFHPSWVRTSEEDVRLLAPFDHFWRRELPGWAKRNPDDVAMFAHAQKQTGGGDRLHENQVVTQKNMKEVGLVLHADDTWAMLASDASPAVRAGWPDTDRIEAWRYENAVFHWSVLQKDASYGVDPSTTRSDWVQPYVDLPALRADRERFNRLWYAETTAEMVPRNWLRWAVRTVQLRFKLRESDGQDEQLAAYLPDCDVFLTEDQRFFLVLTEISKAAPARMGSPVKVSRAAESPADEIARAIEFESSQVRSH